MEVATLLKEAVIPVPALTEMPWPLGARFSSHASQAVAEQLARLRMVKGTDVVEPGKTTPALRPLTVQMPL